MSKGPFEGTKIRAEIVRVCSQVEDSVCKLTTTNSIADEAVSFSEPAMLLAGLAVKRASRFCLEPPGASALRKGMADAFQHGCVPVVFLRPQEIGPHGRLLWPWHLARWRHDALFVVDPDAFLNRSLDLHALLASIPEARVSAMLRSVARHSARLAYLISPPADEDDAADILLKGFAGGATAV